MKKNLGLIDRIARVVAAGVVFTLYFTHIIGGIPAIALLIVSGIIAITAFVGFCPVYSIFHLSSRKKKNIEPIEKRITRLNFPKHA